MKCEICNREVKQRDIKYLDDLEVCEDCFFAGVEYD